MSQQFYIPLSRQLVASPFPTECHSAGTYLWRTATKNIFFSTVFGKLILSNHKEVLIILHIPTINVTLNQYCLLHCYCEGQIEQIFTGENVEEKVHFQFCIQFVTGGNVRKAFVEKRSPIGNKKPKTGSLHFCIEGSTHRHLVWEHW